MERLLFKDRVALVTGGTKGIGKAICLHLALHGCRVACGYGRDQKAAEAYEQEFLQKGYQGKVYQCDVTEPDQIVAMVGQMVRDFGRIDILVNNAGITSDKTVLKMEAGDWQKVLRTNLSSCFYLSKAVLPHMLKAKFGRIINISSVIGLSGNIGQANYASAKAGLFGFTKTLALETARKGITVNAVAPGFVRTEMTEKISPEIIERILDQIPMRRFAEPHEISRVVVFLAQEESSYITGQIYGINGGLYM
ncbi:MAG: 3-oxoacyl-[acyl-carrier-protein] reductase [candidate division NC10 bacterium]|nr:3-oxoacyl-[acyl-carrier-protein] reductase [candidate division NC10 bacterium]